MVRERLAGRYTGDPLGRGEGLGLSTELPDWELGSCEGFLARGFNEDHGESLNASQYLGKNIGVVDRSLYLYFIFTFRIYIATLVVCFTSLA